MGARGWSWDEVLPYFRKAQHQERGENDHHAQGGPLNVCDFPARHPVSAALIRACEEAGIPYKECINTGDQEGVTWFQLTMKAGRRHSAAFAYLHPAMKRDNLHVELRAMTTRVLFEGKKAVGVELRQDGETRRVMARREVILAAGSVESPKLLEISGIGQGALLQSRASSWSTKAVAWAKTCRIIT